MKTVLIIGATGYIGSCLVNELKHCSNVIGTSRRGCGNHLVVDITDTKTWSNIPWQGIDTVIFLPAASNIKWCEANREAAYAFNVRYTRKFLEYTWERKKNIIWFSTNQVFNPVAGHIDSEVPMVPQNFYGVCKAEIDNYLQSYPSKVAIVRITKVIGKEFPLFKSWVRSALAGKAVECFTDLYCAPISLMWLCRRVSYIVNKGAGGVFQFSGAEDVSYYDLALRLFKQQGITSQCVLKRSASAYGVKPQRYGSLTICTSVEENVYGQSVSAVLNEYCLGEKN